MVDTILEVFFRFFSFFSCRAPHHLAKLPRVLPIVSPCTHSTLASTSSFLSSLIQAITQLSHVESSAVTLGLRSFLRAITHLSSRRLVKRRLASPHVDRSLSAAHLDHDRVWRRHAANLLGVAPGSETPERFAAIFQSLLWLGEFRTAIISPFLKYDFGVIDRYLLASQLGSSLCMSNLSHATFPSTGWDGQ